MHVKCVRECGAAIFFTLYFTLPGHFASLFSRAFYECVCVCVCVILDLFIFSFFFLCMKKFHFLLLFFIFAKGSVAS